MAKPILFIVDRSNCILNTKGSVGGFVIRPAARDNFMVR